MTWKRTDAEMWKEPKTFQAMLPEADDSFIVPPMMPALSASTSASTVTNLSRDPSASSFSTSSYVYPSDVSHTQILTTSSLTYESPNTLPDLSETEFSSPCRFSSCVPVERPGTASIARQRSPPPTATEAVLRCELCGKPFHGQYRATNRQRHMREKHGNAPRYRCPHEGCETTMLRKSNLEHHMKVHTGRVLPVVRDGG